MNSRVTLKDEGRPGVYDVLRNSDDKWIGTVKVVRREPWGEKVWGGFVLGMHMIHEQEGSALAAAHALLRQYARDEGDWSG